MAMFAIGCGGGTSQSTPENTFKGFKAAVSNDDWESAFKYLTSDSQDMLLGSVVMASTFSVGLSQDKEKGKDLEELLKKHGIKMDVEKKPAGDPSAAMKSLVTGVKDKGACFQELTKFMEEMSQGKEKDSGPADKIKKTVFKDAKIEGDKATVTFTVDGEDQKEPMIFKKKDGKWFIDMVASEGAAGGPGK